MTPSNFKKKFIHAGELHVAVEPTEIVTVLGSCVAVCLYDKQRQIGAMNHYLLPYWKSSAMQTPKFGDISISRLVESFYNMGSALNNIEAKVFGGANMTNVTQEEMMIGQKNIMVAKEMLKKYKIAIKASDTGGTQGRRILMQSHTGKVLMKYVQKSEGV